MRVLLIEDNIELADITALNLKKHGFAVDVAYSGEEALCLFEGNGEYDVVILDLILPDIEGTKLLQDLKSMVQNVPVLALTARDGEEDRISGIQMGFDDYMTKPFSHYELAARLRLLTRSRPYQADETIKIGPLQINHKKQTTLMNGVSVKLTLNEFRLLHFLVEHKGQVVPIEKLIKLVWDRNGTNENGKVITTVSRVRAKIGDYRKNIIRTCKNGYILGEANG